MKKKYTVIPIKIKSSTENILLKIKEAAEHAGIHLKYKKMPKEDEFDISKNMGCTIKTLPNGEQVVSPLLYLPKWMEPK